jgi:thioredoxin 1
VGKWKNIVQVITGTWHLSGKKPFEFRASGDRFLAMLLMCRLNLLIVAAVAASFCLLTGCDHSAAMNESSPNVKHITQGEFADEVTRCPQPVVVDFYATWCGPCREMSLLLDRVAGGYTDKIKFVKVNLDESPGLAQNYDVQQIPLLLLFKDGKLADRIPGVPLETDLKSKLDALAAK